MKNRIPRPMPANSTSAIVMAVAISQMTSLLFAAPLTWDSDATFANGVNDGSGIWDTSTANWSNGASNVAWINANNDTAIFGNGGTGGNGTTTVTLGTGITVGGLTFNTSSTTAGYIIAGGGNALTFGGNSTVTANTKTTISAALAGNFTITKGGSGILELSGGGTVANIRSGPITGSLFITGGTYSVGGINFYDKGIVTDDDGTIFQTGGTIVTTPKDWDGRFNASPYNISGGSLTVTTVNRIRGIGTFNASGDSTVTFNTNDARISSDNVSGALSLNGNASVTFSSNTLLNLVNSASGASGVLNLGGGVLTAAAIYNAGGATTTGIVNFNGGTLKASSGGSGFFNANAQTTVNVYGGGAIVDSNGLNIGISQPFLATTGNGIDAVNVSAGGSGYTTAPSVTFSGGGGTGATGYALIDTNGTVTSIVITNPGKNYTSAPTVTFGSGSASATATAALVNASGGLTKIGGGTLTMSGANTYTGATRVNTGTLQAGVASIAGVSGAFGNNSAVILADTSGVSLNLNGFNTQIGSLTGGGASGGNVTASANLTTGGDNTSPAAYAGVISGSGSLIKIGTGTQNLSGENNYSGATAVNAGTLEVSGSGSINNTSGITVSAGGTFRHNSSVVNTRTVTLNGDGNDNRATLAGNGTFSTAITLDNLGDTLAPGNSTGIQSFTTGQTWTSFSYDFELQDFAGTTPGSSFDQIAIAGTLNLNGTAYQLNLQSLTLAGESGDVGNFSETNRSWTILTTTGPIIGFDASEWILNTSGFSSGPTYQGAFSLANSGNDLVLSYAAIPEPSTCGAFLTGFGMLACFQRIRRPQA